MRGPVAHGGGDGGGGGRGPLKWVLPLALALGVVGFGIWRFGERWISRLHYALQAGNALQDGAREEETEIPPQNFWFDDCVVLFVRHPSVGEVARACTDYWRATLRRPLTILTNAEAEFGHGQFELWQEQGGYVRLFGGLDWPEAQYEGLARHLSDRFKTQVFEARAVSFSGAYHFGAYDQGTRQFHARMEPEIRNGTVDDKVSTENAPWAVANGYQPGKDGFQSFTLSDADKITQQLGMKTWGGGTNQAAGAVWLRETGRAGN